MTSAGMPRRLVRGVVRRPVLPVLLALCALLTLLLQVTPAAAHANLVRSDPAAGAVLPSSPAQVQLWFSEEPDPHFSQVQVLDAQRHRVDTGEMRVAAGDPLSLIAGVQPLGDGLYTIAWKTVSAVDGHVVNGSVPFYVGQPPAGAANPAADQQTAPAGGGIDRGAVVDRWLSLISSIVLFGAFAFPLLILLPAWRRAFPPHAGPGAMATPATLQARGAPADAGFERRTMMVLVTAWTVLALATLFALLAHTHTAAGVGIGDLFGTPLRTVLLHTRYGRTWWLRCGATVLAGLVILVRARGRASAQTATLLSVLGVAAVEAVFLAYSLNSHAAALQSDSSLATLSDLLHLSATALWLGGLAQFVIVVPAALRSLALNDRLQLLAAAVPRFSTLALGCVATLIVTGVYQAVRQLPGWSAHWETGYGRTLLLKISLIAPLLMLGAVTLRFIRPALDRAVHGTTGGRFDRRITRTRLQRTFFSAVLAESVLGLAILIVVGLLVNQAPPQAAQAAPAGGIQLRAKAEAVEVRLTVTPGVLGQNRFEAAVSDHGKPPAAGTVLVLRLTYQDADLGTSEVRTMAEGGGRFSADSADLSTYGHWQVQALVQPPAADEVRTEFALTLSDSGASGSGRQAGAATSVQRGRQLYQANCARCHGQSGHGDGPEAKRLDPAPADLVVHVPQHSDQQIYDWLTNGIPLTAMPAFGGKLGQDEQQALINYLRSLSPPPASTP